MDGSSHQAVMLVIVTHQTLGPLISMLPYVLPNHNTQAARHLIVVRPVRD